MNFFLCFDQKPPLLYNYVFTEVVPFRKYCHIYIRDSRLNRPESVSLASLARQ